MFTKAILRRAFLGFSDDRFQGVLFRSTETDSQIPGAVDHPRKPAAKEEERRFHDAPTAFSMLPRANL
jgi:hypothetical protein